MFSPFRPRRSDEPGSGGKAHRERRRADSVSPYARLENSQPSPPPPAENPRWLPGIVTRAGRLLSSVFRSDSSETSSSYSSDADGGGLDSSDEEENVDACTKVRELDETGKSCKSCMAHHEGPEFITQRSERRFAIEKLLLQETFSRDEGDRLIKVILSRVVGTTTEGGPVAGEKELPEKTSHNDLIRGGTWRPLNRGSKFPEGLAYSVNHLSGLSPGTSIFHAYSHDLCDKAILEAKKWLEKKKIESTSKAELNCGPCILNTDALQYRMEDEVGSPVDIAKSYMRERPPWQSPILNNISFKTPPIGVHLFGDESPHAIFSTSKALKRSYLTTDLDDTRSVRSRSMENPPDSGQVQSSIAILEHETCPNADGRNMPVDSTDQDLILLSAIETPEQVNTSAGIPEKMANEDRVALNSCDESANQENKSNSLLSTEMAKLVDSSTNVAAKLAVEDVHPEAISGPKNVQTFEVNHSTNDVVNTKSDEINETCNLVSTDSIPDPEESVDIVNLYNEIDTETVLPPEKETGMEFLSSVSDCPDMKQTGAEQCFFLDREPKDTFIIETSQDMEAPPSLEKHDKNALVRDGFASQETSVNHNDARDYVECFEAAVLEELGSEGVKSSLSSNPIRASSDSKIHVSGVHVDPSAEEERQDHRSPLSELLASPEVEDTPVDKTSVDGEVHVEKEVIPATGSTPNGDLSLQTGSSSNMYIRHLKRGSRHLPTPTNGRLSAVSAHAETGNLSTDDSVVASGDRGTIGVQKPQNGTTMKSNEQMLAENPPVSRHGRGRKVAARSGRGRGRGRGK